MTGSGRPNPNLDARLGGGAGVIFAADVAGEDGTANVKIGGREAVVAGQQLLETVARLVAELPSSKAVEKLSRLVAQCPDATLRSPALHEGMNDLFSKGDDRTIRAVHRSQLEQRPKGRPLDTGRERGVREIERYQEEHPAASVAEATRELASTFHVEPATLANAHTRNKEAVGFWRSHVVPGSVLMDRRWRHPEWKYQATPAEAAMDPLVGGAVEVVARFPDLKERFIAAFEAKASVAELTGIVQEAFRRASRDVK